MFVPIGCRSRTVTAKPQTQPVITTTDSQAVQSDAEAADRHGTPELAGQPAVDAPSADSPVREVADAGTHEPSLQPITPKNPLPNQPPAPTQPLATLPADRRVETLTDPAADAAARAAAAKSLIADEVTVANTAAQGGGTPSAVRSHMRDLQPILQPDYANQQAQLILLREITAAPSAPAWLAKPLAALPSHREDEGSNSAVPQGEIQIEAVRALGSVRTREAAKALLELTSNEDAPVAEAFAALARLSGRDDLGMDRARWDAWFGQIEWLSEAQWRKALVDSLAARADGLAIAADTATSRLLEFQRRRYQSTESMTDRSALLAGMMRDDLEPIQRLGFQLATQELANARPLDASVADAAAIGLQSTLPDLRVAAASLLRLIGSESQAALVAAALARETDPSAAEVLLQCAARFPLADSLAPTQRWLERFNGSPACGAAVESAFAHVNAGHAAAPATAASLRESLQRTDVSKLSESQAARYRELLARLTP